MAGEEQETRAEEIERHQEEIQRRQERIRRLRQEEHREGGTTLEEFEGMSADQRRQIKEDDPELWNALMTAKQEKAEEALGVDRGPLAGRRQ